VCLDEHGGQRGMEATASGVEECRIGHSVRLLGCGVDAAAWTSTPGAVYSYIRSRI
jgi:hypothetical protein